MFGWRGNGIHLLSLPIVSILCLMIGYDYALLLMPLSQHYLYFTMVSDLYLLAGRGQAVCLPATLISILVQLISPCCMFFPAAVFCITGFLAWGLLIHDTGLLLIFIPIAHRTLLLSSSVSVGSFPLELLSFPICCSKFHHRGRLLALGSAVTRFSSMHTIFVVASISCTTSVSAQLQVPSAYFMALIYF